MPKSVITSTTPDYYDALLTTTMANYQKRMEDNYFDRNVVLYYLKRKNCVELIDGGASIDMPLLYGANDTVAWYSGYDSITPTPQEGITKAQFIPKELAVAITISNREMDQNSGTERFVDLLKAKIMQAERSFDYQMEVGLFSDGTGSSNKELTGLKAMVTDTGTYGGISRSSYTWWKANVDSTSIDFDSNSAGINAMRSMYNEASQGGLDYPDLIITTQTIHEQFETELSSNLRYEDTEMANAGFRNILFKNAPVVWSGQCPSGYMYFLNTSYIRLKVYRNRNKRFMGWRPGFGQTARYGLISWMGNLLTGNCRMHGVLTNIS